MVRAYSQALAEARRRLGPRAMLRSKELHESGQQVWAYVPGEPAAVAADTWENLRCRLMMLPISEAKMTSTDAKPVKLLTTKALAKLYNVSPSTISNNVGRCDLPVEARKGRNTMFDPEAVEKWLKTHQERLKPRPGGRHPRRIEQSSNGSHKNVQVHLNISSAVVARANRLVKAVQETPFKTSLANLVEHGLNIALREAERTFSK